MLSGTGPSDEGSEKLAEMFHLTMISYLTHGSLVEISLKHFLEIIFTAITKTVLNTHTKKVFVVPWSRWWPSLGLFPCLAPLLQNPFREYLEAQRAKFQHAQKRATPMISEDDDLDGLLHAS
ncbi:vacuole membrane protein 1-like [Danio aesculapii]|uniref:vacuole membrane protein 1-like n=1 Tax=Danio aesculapii TaxID=1142201 RepID=UPI0024BF8A35|nr:vacuole membrane protein 1-like [Danio aesculapii]